VTQKKKVLQFRLKDDSKADESRTTNSNNFFANPFQLANPIFGGAVPGFTGQSAAGSARQETLSRDGDHHGGGGYQVSIHDDGGYQGPML
jgi:hypothetical protein